MNPYAHLNLDPITAHAELNRVADPSGAEPDKTACWLLDVREAHEVARTAYAVPHVLHLPLSQLEQRHTELPRDADLIVACAAGGRSLQAMQFLLHRGHTQVRNLAGGLGAWMAHGLPVQQG